MQWRKDIRKSDDSEFGRLFVKRLNETKEEERQRIVESRLQEERRVAQTSRRGGRGGNGPPGPAGRGGRGSQSAGASSRPGGSNGGGDNVICSWCQVSISYFF